MEPKIFDTKMCKYGIFVAKMCKYGIFVAKICKYGIFVAKICKYALIDSFQGYAAVLDSSTNCAALPNDVLKEEAVSGRHFEKIPLVLPLDGQRAHVGWNCPCYMQEYFCPN